MPARTAILSTVSFRLLAALVLVAALTAVAVVTALITFDRIRASHDSISQRDLPKLSAASGLARTASGIASAAHALTAADTRYVLRTAKHQLTDRLKTLDRHYAVIDRYARDTGELDLRMLTLVRERRDDLIRNIDQIETAVLRRIAVETDFEAEIAEAWTLMSRRGVALLTGPNTAADNQDWRRAELFNALQRQVARLPILGNRAQVGALELRAIQTFNELDALGGPWLPRPQDGAVIAPPDDLRDLLFADLGVFQKRAELLALERQQDGLLTRNKFASSRFVSAVADVFFAVQENVDARNAAVAETVEWNSSVLIAVSVLSVATIVGLILFVRRSILARLTRLTKAVDDRVIGAPSEIPVQGRDELAHLGQALTYFVESISERETRLNEARIEAEQASRAKSEFLAIVSHEVRTPLNGVLAMAQFILETDLDAEQRDYAETIVNSGETLLLLLNDILDFSKAEAGKLTVDSLDFETHAMLEGAVDLMAGRAVEKGLTVGCFIAPDLPEHLHGDPDRLRQIITNLVSNAIKFTEKGGVTIAATRVGGTPAARLRVEVRDTGIGILPAKQAELFAAFTQADLSTSRRYGGTGLGLSICRRLVDLMDGEIGVESALGSGALFWFEIPLQPARLPVEASRLPDLARLSVAVVDADDFSRHAAGQYLWAAGASVVAVPRLDDLRTEEDGTDFDVVVSDQEDLVAIAAAAGQRNPPPVILVADRGKVQQVTNTDGAARYAGLIKRPIARTPLLEAVAAATGKPDSAIAPMPAATVQPMSYFKAPMRAAAEAEDSVILVAEDNPTNRRIIEKLIQRLGFVADLVYDGEQALRALESGSYGLLITDCHMPVLDGFDLAREIRSRERTTGLRLPIVALTADAQQTSRDRCIDSGMDDCLTKPVALEALDAVIAERLPRAVALRTEVTQAPRPSPKSALATASSNTPNATSPAAPPSPEIAVLDVDPLLQAFGSMNADALDMLVDGVEAAQALMDDFMGSLKATDLAALESQAHAVRGLCLNFGVNRIAAMMEEYETAFRAAAAFKGDDKAIAAEWAHVLAAVEQLKRQAALRESAD